MKLIRNDLYRVSDSSNDVRCAVEHIQKVGDMEPVIDYGMTLDEFANKYQEWEVLPRSTADEDRAHALEVLLNIAPDIVIESEPTYLIFEDSIIEVSHVTTPEGDVIITKNDYGSVATLTYIEEPFTEDVVYQMVVDSVCATFSEEMI